MATLYERLTGVGLEADSNAKIGIHAFISGLYEINRGYLTGADLNSYFDFTEDQITTVQTFISYVNAAPDTEKFMRVFRDISYLAETGAAYQTQQEFVQRLQAEITDQGGTVP
jgi:hypothetical protein